MWATAHVRSAGTAKRLAGGTGSIHTVHSPATRALLHHPLSLSLISLTSTPQQSRQEKRAPLRPATEGCSVQRPLDHSNVDRVDRADVRERRACVRASVWILGENRAQHQTSSGSTGNRRRHLPNVSHMLHTGALQHSHIPQPPPPPATTNPANLGQQGDCRLPSVVSRGGAPPRVCVCDDLPAASRVCVRCRSVHPIHHALSLSHTDLLLLLLLSASLASVSVSLSLSVPP